MADFHKQNSKKKKSTDGNESVNLPKTSSENSAETAGPKSPVALAEEKVLEYWQEKNIFQKTLDKPAPNGNYVFYDGPPFATGLPHYGHILISTIKDAVPRYQTMRGKHVERRWGWDCHGLPIENIVEKELRVSGKKEIEAIGIDTFNEYARSKVLGYAHEWKRTIGRIGRWVDYDGAYMTMDNTFIESVWWTLKSIWDKNLIYEGTKVLPYCPRCETPIANSEIAMDGSYKDITDISVYVKLALENEPKTYLIAWTTTPWTLPGNTAAAVNEELDYVIAKIGDEYYIVAKNKTSIFKDQPFEIVEEIKGRALVGKKFKPPFDYFTGDRAKNLPNKENAWQVYAAPYVTAETGSGIVHLAPAYGEEDMVLAKEHNIPFIRHVGGDGKFIAEVTDFAGQKAKPKEDHQAGDVLIIKNLAARGLLFAKEKITHSYPHCFRCETPLYYFALPAWFIKILEVKNELIKNNEQITWIPEHLKYGRFKINVEGAPDWNISRNRYWASPLPFWRCDKCDQVECVGSLDHLKSRSVANNKYFVMRHGEAEFNLIDKVSCSVDDKNSLTEKGRAQAVKAATDLKSQKIDLIYASDLVRGKETAELVAKELGLPADSVYLASEIRELNAGVYNGKTWTELRNSFASPNDRFETAPEGGESLLALRDRATKFIYDLEKKHVGKKILIISHGDTLLLMGHGINGLNKHQLVTAFKSKGGWLETGQWQALDFAPIPHNKNFELDFHRPYVDDIFFTCKSTANASVGAGVGICGGTMKRVPEVVDGWFESGSMPFAQSHYPFENKDKFEANFPADFVAEYIAQTRTWFYYMHAVSTILFGKAPFKHVLTTGNVLADDGAKMSKSKGNFPDPWILFNKFGVDALRFYLLSSPLMKSEDLNFTEKGVDEIYKKIILRLRNVLSFYETYEGEKKSAVKNDADGPAKVEFSSQHVLDRWIMERLNVVISQVTSSMDAYELDKALSPIDSFIEDISVWFLRRSRERLKSENEVERKAAISTFYIVLMELSKLIAPFTPFLAEEIYRKLGGTKDSVHLEDWPTTQVTSVDNVILLADMDETRRLVSLTLEARAKAGIKVRQPLQKLAVKGIALEDKKECIALLLDEVNVKEIIFDPELAEEVVLDTDLTDSLREEGNLREFIRFVQDLRKKAGLNPGEPAQLSVSMDGTPVIYLGKFGPQIEKAAHISKTLIVKDLVGEEIEIDGQKFNMKVEAIK